MYGSCRPAWDAVEKGIAHRDEAVGGRLGGVDPGLQRRQPRVVGFVHVVHAVMHRRPAPRTAARFIRLPDYLRVLLVELPQVVRRPVDKKRRGARHARQKLRIGLGPAVAQREVVEHLEFRRLAVHQQIARRPGRGQLPVVGDVIPVVAEILRGERMPVRPAVPLAQLEREHASVLDLEALHDVGNDVELPVVADQPRVAVDHQQARVAAAPDQRVERAAVLARGLRVDHQRRLRQPLLHRRQPPGLDVGREHRCFNSKYRKRNIQGKPGRSHAERTRWLSPRSTSPGRRPGTMR